MQELRARLLIIVVFSTFIDSMGDILVLPVNPLGDEKIETGSANLLIESCGFKLLFDESLLQEEIIRLPVYRYAPTLGTLFPIVLNFGSLKVGRVQLDN